MKTRDTLCGVLVVLLAGCLSEPLEGASGRVGEDGDDTAGGNEGDSPRQNDGDSPAAGDHDSNVPAIGDACTRDVCASGRYLRVCAAEGTFAWDVDCSVNQGECVRDGERERCRPVGWECQTRCLDDHTIEICWSDLSQTTERCDGEGFDGEGFDGYVCDPEGAFDPLTGRSSAVCVPGEGAEVETCDCDSYETDGALCCDAGCECDVDCGAGERECGAPADPEPREDDPSTPDGWDCDAAYYGTGDGCDCECGAPDPDCEGDDSEPYGCPAGEYCDADGHCAS